METEVLHHAHPALHLPTRQMESRAQHAQPIQIQIWDQAYALQIQDTTRMDWELFWHALQQHATLPSHSVNALQADQLFAVDQEHTGCPQIPQQGAHYVPLGRMELASTQHAPSALLAILQTK
jgi:hypothetical protein